MAIEVFNGTSIPRELTTAAMEFLWVKWKTLNDTNDLSLQRLTEECSYELRSNSIHLLSVGDDYVHMYVGEGIQAAADEPLAGSLLSQQANPLKREFAEVYRQVATRLAPAFIRFTASWSQSGQLWQRLVLPICITDGAVVLVVYSEMINHQLEVYDHLFRTAPDAMIIACPITNDVGHTSDGWVLMMNDRARHLLNFNDSIGNLRLTQLPQFAGVDFWGRLYAPKPSTAVTLVTTPDFDVEIMRFPHAFGLRLRAKYPALSENAATLVPAGATDGALTSA